MAFVLDASLALAWVLEDEENAYADRVMAALATEEAKVPAIWPIEVANALVTCVRRKRLAHDQPAEIFRRLAALRIRVSGAPPVAAFGRLSQVAIGAGLSAYDAMYLDLALTEHVSIASLDGPLERAARKLGVPRYLE